jgi:hypothetical protein
LKAYLSRIIDNMRIELIEIRSAYSKARGNQVNRYVRFDD